MNFTIIIPIYNENKNIYNLVNEIINLDFKNYEIIIVDDCSTDEFMKEFETDTTGNTNGTSKGGQCVLPA